MDRVDKSASLIAVIGTDGDDQLYGSKADERVDGRGGSDTFVAKQYYAGLQRALDSNGNWVWELGHDTLVNVEYVQFVDRLVALDDPVLLQQVQHVSTEGDDVLIGNDHGYPLSGHGGNDVLTGNGGDDRLHGGKGDDTTVFRGPRADYKFSYDTVEFWGGALLVSDLVTGRDGTDRLTTMETLRFADGEVSVKSLLAQVPPAPLPQPNPSTEYVEWYVHVKTAVYDFKAGTWTIDAEQIATELRVPSEWTEEFADSVAIPVPASSEVFEALSGGFPSGFDETWEDSAQESSAEPAGVVGLVDFEPGSWFHAMG